MLLQAAGQIQALMVSGKATTTHRIMLQAHSFCQVLFKYPVHNFATVLCLH